MSGINNTDIIKGQRRFTGVGKPFTGAFCHRNMYDMLRLRQVLRKEILIIRHRGRHALCHHLCLIHKIKQHRALRFPPIGKDSRFGVNRKRNHREIEPVRHLYGQIRHALCRDQKRNPFSHLMEHLVGFVAFFVLPFHRGDQFLREQRIQHMLKRCGIHRLDQIIIKTLPTVQRLVFTAGVCRQNNDRHLAAQPSRLFPDGVQTFDAVHFRHHVIHQDHMVMILQCQIQAFLCAFGGKCGNPGLSKQLRSHQKISRIVVNDQNLCLGCLKMLMVFIPDM